MQRLAFGKAQEQSRRIRPVVGVVGDHLTITKHTQDSVARDAACKHPLYGVTAEHDP
jgi:hypothetical protein